MGVLEVVDETFRLYRRHFLGFVLASAIVAVPVAVLSILLLIVLGISGQSGGPAGVALVAAGALAIPLGLLGVLAYLAQGVALTRLASAAVLGEPLTVRNAYRGFVGRVLPMIWTGLLSGLALLLLSMTVVGIPFAVYLGLGWSLAIVVLVLESRAGRGALGRSGALVAGSRWRVLGVLLLLGLLGWVLTSVPAGLVGVLGALASELVPGGRWLETAFSLLSTLVSALTGALFAPLGFIASTVLYYELRVRKEAFDLERLAGQAAVDPSDSPTLIL
jgi:hypothetical protein